ncbi:hypothetical protein [Oceanobacillus halophilus]|uniref:Uncharacterized protein n=1 Tax=Oceanobacillus halophilus TaxID=930130 RepID=A0A495A621_9BACI|nr:hypothetical protein [Oceanobacillus halophilus]RKQ34730.1 hypothetical protein D8M06_07385 [Oceanobacillus halophilus]
MRYWSKYTLQYFIFFFLGLTIWDFIKLGSINLLENLGQSLFAAAFFWFLSWGWGSVDDNKKKEKKSKES